MTRALAALTAAALVSAAGLGGSAWQGGDWPRKDAPLKVMIAKTAGEEMVDPVWAHLHQGMAGAESVSFGVTLQSDDSAVTPASQVNVQLRYTVRGVPVSDWLGAPFAFTLDASDPDLNGVLDGIHDVSVQAQGPERMRVRPIPIFLHIARGRAVADTVPIISQDHQSGQFWYNWGSGVEYVRYGDVAASRDRAFPVRTGVTAWHDPPFAADLYQEQMAPHTNLFMGHQMWWEEPPGTPSAGLKFVRALVPKHDEDLVTLRTLWHHDRFPFTDGPRGVAWTSPYTGGQVGPDGTLYFVEKGGPFRMMTPDGTVTTIAGWRVRADRDPVWIAKDTGLVRQNMELRGTWISGQYEDLSGFRTPTDVAIDPANPRVFYITGFEDHCIWKVDATAGFDAAVITVLAGDPRHRGGYLDAERKAARFNRPVSLVFDPLTDALYVAEQDNHTIRRVTREGVVTTVFGRPGHLQRMLAAGVSPEQYRHQPEARGASVYTVSAAQAAAGVRPEIYFPQTVRVTSNGDLIVLSLGFGAIRRINPATGETVHLADVNQRLAIGGGGVWQSRGWSWLDVDRYGNSGPKDGIYFTAAQASWCVGEPGRNQTNEAWCWMPADGSAQPRFIFNDWEPNPDGWGSIRQTDPPHYGWMIAIDPRGAVYLAGMGEHGFTRLRVRRSDDVDPTDYGGYYRAKELWWRGCPGDPISRALPVFRFGWEGHNYLGFNDAWAFRDATDAELAAAFQIPVSCSREERDTLLTFLRMNAQQVAPASSGRGGRP